MSTPKLRFPEFDKDGWNIQLLGKVAENLDSRRVPITESERQKGKTPYYGASGIIDYIDGYIFDEELLCISEDGANLVARTYPIAFSISGKTWVNNHAHVLKFKKKFTQTIIENYLNSISLEDYLTGMAQPKLNQAKLEIIPIPLPENELEQQKIADCLSSLDDLITAQNQKVEALKQHKKGLMQQLFPDSPHAKGEYAEGGRGLVPKLRFPEFENDEEWRIVKFGDLGLDVSDGNYSSKYPSQSDFIRTGVPFLRANNLKFGTVIDEDMRFISEKQHSEIRKGHLKKGDILLTTRGELGTIALVPERHIGSNINAQLVRVNTQNKLINTFFFQLLDYSRILGHFEMLSTGTALKQLPIGKLNQLNLAIPASDAEQQKIANFLSSIDELISTQTQQLEAYKTHKKGLMQQLFPSLDEVDA